LSPSKKNQTKKKRQRKPIIITNLIRFTFTSINNSLSGIKQHKQIRFTLTNNNSLSGIKVLLNSGKTIKDGEAWADYDLSDSEDEEHVKKKRRIENATSLPGVKVGDTAKA